MKENWKTPALKTKSKKIIPKLSANLFNPSAPGLPLHHDKQKNKQEKETFIASIRDVASDGRGIASHPNGLTVFIPGVWIEEECRIHLKNVRGKIGLGECLEIVKASPYRIQAPCSHHGFDSGGCGACPWQFVHYAEQIRIKQEKVEKAFAQLNFHSVNQFLPSPQEFSYRNRAQLKTDGKAIGFLSNNSHSLAPIESCKVLSEHNQKTLSDLLKQLPKKDWAPRKFSHRRAKRNQKANFTSLNIDESLEADGVLVNKRLPFQQSHSHQNQVMQQWLTKQLQALNSNGPVLELFCGAGNFTEVIAKAIDEDILAVEGDERALEALALKKLNGVTPLHCDLFTSNCFEKIYKHRRDFTTLVLDPPRDGLKNTQHLLSKKSSIQTVLYISCNLATLCRDLEFFKGHGFSIREVQALDLSPHTPHIELMVRLQKTK